MAIQNVGVVGCGLMGSGIAQISAQAGFPTVVRDVSKDVLDIYPRKVHFYPDTGRVRVKKLLSTRNDTIFARERNYLQQVSTAPQSGDVELF